MNPILLQAFVELIARQTGLKIRARDFADLDKRIQARVAGLKLSGPEAYYKFLAQAVGEKQNSELFQASNREWETLTPSLTIGETYFFRDPGQLDILKDVILPEIIARKRQLQSLNNHTKPCLRIWSAGCSSGEEPYSLAIIIKELIPDYANWNLLILGTDLSIEAITRAKQAEYSEWSFRSVKTNIKQKYFIRKNNIWQLNDKIHQMVKFKVGNLLADEYPSLSSDIYNMDLILCRNVFIYFDPENTSKILRKFHQTLAPGGYLVTGHAELHDIKLTGFAPTAYEGSVVYQRLEHPSAQLAASEKVSKFNPSPKSLVVSSPVFSNIKKIKSATASQPDSQSLSLKSSRSTSSRSTTGSATDAASLSTLTPSIQAQFEQGNYQQAIQLAEQVLKTHPNHVQVMSVIAQAYANLGQYNQASYYCQQLIVLNSSSTETYALLAHIAEEQNLFEQAKKWLKCIIYLDPAAVSAYIDLGYLYQAEGEVRKANKMFTNAINLLEDLPLQATVNYRGTVKVAELLPELRKITSLRTG